MTYDEQSFLNGLAAGLSVTGGQFRGAWRWNLTTGSKRTFTPGVATLTNFDANDYENKFLRVWYLQCYETAVIRYIFNSRGCHTIKCEYGNAEDEYQTEFHRTRGSADLETLYFVIQPPGGFQFAEVVNRRYSSTASGLPVIEVDLAQKFHCNSYLYEWDNSAKFNASFMIFPYQTGVYGGGRVYEYPGTPEAVNYWLTATYRGFDVNGNPL